MKKFNGFEEGSRYLVKTKGVINIVEIEVLQITKYAIKYKFFEKSGDIIIWKLKEEFIWTPLEKLRNKKSIEGNENGRTSNRSD